MIKYKYYFCIILWTFMPKISMAVDLELSDVIREARETQMKIAKSQIEQNIENTKKQIQENTQKEEEKSLVEKLNEEEIMK